MRSRDLADGGFKTCRGISLGAYNALLLRLTNPYRQENQSMPPGESIEVGVGTLVGLGCVIVWRHKWGGAGRVYVCAGGESRAAEGTLQPANGLLAPMT